MGILHVGLDDFTTVNDRFGHDAGDELLLAAAHRLRLQIRRQDTVARLGGDEFAVISPGISAVGLAALAGRVTRSLGELYPVHGHTVRVPASVGAHLARPGDPVADVMSAANRAMYTVKRTRPATSITL